MIAIKMVKTLVLNTCVTNEIKQLNRDGVFILSSTMIQYTLLYYVT